jgi:D-alanyl-D-alanine carboxypeptidase
LLHGGATLIFEWILGGLYDAFSFFHAAWRQEPLDRSLLHLLYAVEQAPEAPPVDARAWILMDYASGKVLAEGMPMRNSTRPA